MATVKNRNPPFLKVIFSLSVDIMKAKTQMYYEEKRTMKKTREKKHNKRKIKISKVKKLKPNLLFFPTTDVVHSPFIPLSPLLRRSHALSLSRSLTIVFDSLLCSFVRFGQISCVPSLVRRHRSKRSSQSEKQKNNYAEK